MTGAGMMDCKRALAESGGDVEAAKDWLRKRGQAISDKKVSRALNEGLIRAQIAEDGKVGVLVELKCETDFVARNEQFQKLLGKITQMVATGAPGSSTGSIDEFLAGPDPDNPSQTMADALKSNIATIGENLGVGGLVRYEVQNGSNYLQSYIHPPGKLGVLVEFGVGNPETVQHEKFKELASDVAMHIAAAAPECLDRNSVNAEALERERDIYRDQARNEGKPENLLDKIVMGKLNKFYSNVCLLEQEFVKDNEFTIQKLVDKVSKEIGDTIKILRFERMRVGG